MRLQLTIERHTLPPTHILFSTASHPSANTSSSKATIADLLLDINELVPLESEDGEWGLEDYVVEVAATADQDNVYEALHFQSIKSVLREDDEVIIRYLKSDELKGRRWGGRLQVTRDGRHLVDGVVWGKRAQGSARGGGRPGIEIPPRKRRRILAPDDETGIELEEPLLTIMTEEDQDDDEEYMDDNEVKVVSTFVNADEDESDEDDEIEDMAEDEVQLLLEDAAEVDDAYLELPEAVLERQLKSRTRLGKRKRIVEDDDDEPDFQGFSSPRKSPSGKQVSFDLGDGVTVTRTEELGLLEDSDDSESSELESASSSETSSSGSDDAGTSTTRQVASISAESDTDTETSSSDSSESESDESESSGDSADSSSESESDTSQTSTSSGSESDDEVRKSSMTAATKTGLSPSTNKSAVALKAAPSLKTTPTPPGQGTRATQSRNQRNKLLKKLNKLKADGLLSENANLEDLRAYSANNDLPQSSSSAEASQLEAARSKALAAVQETTTQLAEGEVDTDSPEPSRDTESFQPTAESQAPTSPAAAPMNGSPQSVPGSSAKRSRLDVAASRRLLFGSLGLRAPKTPAEEQELRERLAKSPKLSAMKRVINRNNVLASETVTQDTSEGSWTEKLVISAVECTRDGVHLDPPPFPFEQYTSKRKLRAPAQDQNIELDYGDAEPVPVPDMRFQDIPDSNERQKLKKLCSSLPNFTVRECYEALKACSWNHDSATDLLFVAEASQTLSGKMGSHNTGRAEEVSNGSRTVSFAKDEIDGMPIPTDFEALADLEKDHLLPGAVIAYKELHLNPETMVPDISPYRVARVSEYDGEDLTLVLAVKDRRKPRPIDPETGEAITNDFEIRTSEDDEVDDGVREFEFAQMMTPKLVEAAVQVPGSSAVAELRGGDAASTAHHSSSLVPDSVPSAQNKESAPLPEIEVQQIEIDTPRRKEITTMIKDAGFNSSMDSGLLDPLPSGGAGPADSSQPEVHEDTEHSNVDESSQPAIAEISQAQTNTWSSSPLFPLQESTPVQAIVVDDAGLDSVQSTSSPPISPQLTVDYPHISQMDLDSSYRAPDASTKSSSHQDAQRVPATPADVTLNNEMDDESDDLDDDGDVPFSLGDDAVDALPSEVEESQSQEPSNLQPLSEPNDPDMTPRTNSFLGGRGVDGAGSSPSYHDSDEESQDVSDHSGSESSLPSLSELTSSQRRKIKPKASGLHKGVSPPVLTRAGLRSSEPGERLRKLKHSSRLLPKIINGYDGTNDDDLDLPSSTQLEPESSQDPLHGNIKIASSQKEKRLSQIPLGTQVVDLTMSSDPISPSDSDGRYGTRRRTASRAKKVNGIGAGKAKGKKSMLGASVSDVGAGGGTGVGIGTRRFLTSKKSRSQI